MIDNLPLHYLRRRPVDKLQLHSDAPPQLFHANGSARDGLWMMGWWVVVKLSNKYLLPEAFQWRRTAGNGLRTGSGSWNIIQLCSINLCGCWGGGWYTMSIKINRSFTVGHGQNVGQNEGGRCQSEREEEGVVGQIPVISIWSTPSSVADICLLHV